MKSIKELINEVENNKDYKGYNNDILSINETLKILKKYDNKDKYTWLKQKINKEKKYFESFSKRLKFNTSRDEITRQRYEKALIQYDFVIELIKEERKKFINLKK